MNEDTKEVDIVTPKDKRTNKAEQNNMIYKALLGIVVLLIVAGLSFYGGVSYQKGHASSSTSTSGGSGFSGLGGSRFSGGHVFGTVSSVSSSSIVVQPNSGGSSETFSMTSSTTITDQGQTVSYSDIQSGDTVLITSASSSSTVATRIIVNPSFGGFGGSNSTSPNLNSN